jgi:hypothetical protein
MLPHLLLLLLLPSDPIRNQLLIQKDMRRCDVDV